jgi:integrase
MNDFDVRIYAIRRRKDRRRPFEVRWYATGRPWSRSFITRALADGFRAELIRAARKGAEFGVDSGEPLSWTRDHTAVVSWLQHASTYAAMKWPAAAAHSRAGIADALATITPALTHNDARRPPATLLRAALYGWAFNPGRTGSQPPGIIADALDWAQRHSMPLTSLTDARVTRDALDALTLRSDGTTAAGTTVRRKCAVFSNALSYAVEVGLLAANPLSQLSWRPPRGCAAIDPRATASPPQVEAILAEVARRRPGLTAFFGCLYYAALRPEEAVALTVDACQLPPSGWGTLTLSAAAPRTAAAWTANGTPHERRGLKLRPDGSIRTVPIPPQLVALLTRHLRAHGTAPDGRVFASPRGGLLHESVYGRAWHAARISALGPDLAVTPVARRPYDLRHSALSLWLASGVPPAEIAVRAGNSVPVVLSVYAHSVPGHDALSSMLIERALSRSRTVVGGSPVAQEIAVTEPGTRPLYVRAQLSTVGPTWTRQDCAAPRQKRRQAPELRKRVATRNGIPDGRRPATATAAGL